MSAIDGQKCPPTTPLPYFTEVLSRFLIARSVGDRGLYEREEQQTLGDLLLVLPGGTGGWWGICDCNPGGKKNTPFMTSCEALNAPLRGDCYFPT